MDDRKEYEIQVTFTMQGESKAKARVLIQKWLDELAEVYENYPEDVTRVSVK